MWRSGRPEEHRNVRDFALRISEDISALLEETVRERLDIY